MEINYRFWEPNKGLEDIQAKLFNHANDRNVTGKDIQERYENENIDPKTVRYAFTKEGKPLAYCQARDYPNIGEIHIGYPWGVDDCPLEAKNNLFDELLNYLKTRDNDLKIMATADPRRSEVVEFMKSRNFSEGEKFYRHKYDIEKLADLDVSNDQHQARIAKEEDVDLILQTYIAENESVGRNTDNEAMKTYIQNQITTGNCVVSIKDGKLGSVATPILRDFPNYEDQVVILGFYMILKEHENSARSLLQKIANKCKENGWEDKDMIITASDTFSYENDAFKNLSHETTNTGIRYIVTD